MGSSGEGQLVCVRERGGGEREERRAISPLLLSESTLLPLHLQRNLEEPGAVRACVLCCVMCARACLCLVLCVRASLSVRERACVLVRACVCA